MSEQVEYNITEADIDNDNVIKINVDSEIGENHITFNLSYNKSLFKINYYFSDTIENKTNIINDFNLMLNNEECKMEFCKHSIFSKGFIQFVPDKQIVVFKFDIVAPQQEGEATNYCDMLLIVPSFICKGAFENIIDYLKD